MGVILLFMLARWSWPRFRFDQLMDIGWKVMIPWGLVNFVVVADVDGIRRSAGQFVGLSFEQGMAIVGWSALVLCWLVIAVLDPTAVGNRPRRELPADGDTTTIEIAGSQRLRNVNCVLLREPLAPGYWLTSLL